MDKLDRLLEEIRISSIDTTILACVFAIVGLYYSIMQNIDAIIKLNQGLGLALIFFSFPVIAMFIGIWIYILGMFKEGQERFNSKITFASLVVSVVFYIFLVYGLSWVYTWMYPDSQETRKYFQLLSWLVFFLGVIFYWNIKMYFDKKFKSKFPILSK